MNFSVVPAPAPAQPVSARFTAGRWGAFGIAEANETAMQRAGVAAAGAAIEMISAGESAAAPEAEAEAMVTWAVRVRRVG